MPYFTLISAILFLLTSGCKSPSESNKSASDHKTDQTMIITSPAFKKNEQIPEKYSCMGENINPPLIISETPKGTQSLAFILDDPDAPSGTFTHWIMWNISPDTTRISENILPPNAIQGQNSMGENHYFGPCPPSGTHHYHFQIFALDTALSLSKNASKTQLINAMKGHIMAHGEIIGLYHK